MRSRPDSNLATLEAVYDLSVAVGSIADPHEATAWLAERAAGVVRADAAALYVWHAPTGRLRLRQRSGALLFWLPASVAPGDTLAGETFARARPVVVELSPGLSPSPGAVDQDLGPDCLPPGAQAAIAVPLRSGAYVAGVLIVFYADQRRVPSAALYAVSLLAVLLGAGLQAVATHETELQEATTRAFRTSTSRVLANALDLETTLERVGQLAVPQLADWCTLDLVAPDGTIHWLALVHGDVTKVARERELLRHTPPNLAMATGDAVVAFRRDAVQSAAGLGSHSLLVMPLRANGKFLGVLSLKRIGADRPYCESERTELAEHLATRCSQALGNAHVYHAAQEEIAERRRSELALRESQGRTAAILEAALDSIITFDLSGQITEFNSAAERAFGLSRDAVLGQPFTSVVGVAAEHGQPGPPLDGSARRDVQLRRSDGTLRWAVISASPLLGALGERVGTVVMVTDISERKHAEEALRANEERFRKQYKGFPLPTYSWLRVGDDFVLQDFNDAAEAVTGG
ncbi:MAG TPA: PAS domain S-box protein, partial [Chloroflexota bacterium]|nr:PAS domain S-box protein [Chloroflexota bacterium]